MKHLQENTTNMRHEVIKMPWSEHYQPPSAIYWHGRRDIPAAACFFQNINLISLFDTIPTPNQLAFGLLGFCCDVGISRNSGRSGAASGPSHIREALAKLPLQRQHILCYDAGDIICTDDNLELAQAALGEAVYALMQQHIIPIVLGGGHELAWGHYQGIRKKYPTENLGIVNFDAHFDMRPLLPDNKGSSGTPFLQIAKAHEKEQKRFDYNCIGIQQAGNIQALFDTANQYQAHVILADELHQNEIVKHTSFIERILTQNQTIYVSLCLDVFASAYAPGVSAPQSLGLSPWQVIPFLRQLAASKKVVSYDIAEMSPPFDIDMRTAKLAANLIYEIIHHHL